MISKKQSRTTETNFISKISKILGNTRNEITIPEKKKSVEIQTDETIINKFIETAKKQNWLVHQAQSSNNVLTLIEKILIKTKAKNIVRTNEEIINRLDLNKYLKSKNYKETIIFNKKPLTSEKIKNICSKADIGISSADFAIAETGSIVIIPGSNKSKMVSLLPTTHIVIIHPKLIINSLEELFLKLPEIQKNSSINIISGPSRTADIEQTIVIGAHGPKEVHLIICDSD